MNFSVSSSSFSYFLFTILQEIKQAAAVAERLRALDEEAEKAAYTSKHLAGLAVAHDETRFEPGNERERKKEEEEEEEEEEEKEEEEEEGNGPPSLFSVLFFLLSSSPDTCFFFVGLMQGTRRC